MIYDLAPGVEGVVISTPGHGGHIPIIERVIHERGVRGIYKHTSDARKENLTALQITLSGCGSAKCAPTSKKFHRESSPTIPRGKCLAIRFGQNLTYEVAEGYPDWEFLYVNLAGSAAIAIVQELSAFNPVLTIDLQVPVMRRLLDMVGQSKAHHRRLDVATSMRLACDLLCAVTHAAQPLAEPERDLVEDACEILSGSIGENIGISGVAQTCGVSREHLTRLFVKRLGMPPAAWLRKERLHHAEVLLRSGSLSVNEIAKCVGFSTTSHFILAFRQTHGFSPGRWRG